MQSNLQVGKSNQSLVFNADGSLTADGKKACELMKIMPQQLRAITEDDLVKEGVPEHIAKVRIEHLQEKRHHRIEMLENTIREGIHHQLYSVLEAFNSKDPMVAAQQLLAQQKSQYLGSDYRLDVPLREPLDPEYRLNRKLAKQIYNKEKEEKVTRHKEDLYTEVQQMHAQKKKQQEKSQKEKDKKYQKDREAIYFELDKVKDKREKVKKDHQMMIKDREDENKEKSDLIREQEKVLKDKKVQDYRDQQNKQFAIDIANFKHQESKGSDQAKAMAASEREVQNSLFKFDKNMRKGQDQYDKNVDRIKNVAKDHNVKVQEAVDENFEIEQHKFLESAFQVYRKQESAQKNRKDYLKKMTEFQKDKTDKRMEKQLLAKDRLKNIKEDHKDRFDHLIERQTQMNNLIKEFKEAYQEEVDQKKEISLLKKKDQIENFERGKNFHNLYKQKLVERLLEKKERAERVKDQQRKIANMCATQRVRVSRSIPDAGLQILNSQAVNAQSIGKSGRK